jgi:hypothetical protein
MEFETFFQAESFRRKHYGWLGSYLIQKALYNKILNQVYSWVLFRKNVLLLASAIRGSDY